MAMERKLIYDLPTRVFHWTFAGLFVAAFTIAKTIDDEAASFSWHMLVGLTIGLVVLLRILWGFAGTKHARFTDFVLSPGAAVRYFGGILTGHKRRWAGHNPASSWAALIMMGLALGLGLTGWLMASGGNPEAIEDVHELLANSFLILVVLHIAGVALHTLRHNEMIGLSMIDGRKAQVPDSEAISSPRSVFALLFIALAAAFALQLWNNFDPGARTLQLFGTTLQLGESGHGHDGHQEEEHDDDDD